MFSFLLDQHHGPLSGVYFLDPILGPVSGPPFLSPLSGTPFRSPQWIQKTKKCFALRTFLAARKQKTTSIGIYRADLMVTLKRMDEYNARMFEVLHQNFNAASNASVVDAARKKQNPKLGRPLAVSPVFVAKNDPHFGALKAHVFQAMK